MNKKTVFLIRNITKDGFGGGETYQILLARELLKYGFTPVVVSSSRGLLKVARAEGFKAVEAPYYERQNYSGVRNLLLSLYFLRLRKIRKMVSRLVFKISARSD